MRVYRGIIVYYLEYQSVCLIVGIRYPHPLPPKASVSPPLGPKGRGVTLSCGLVGGPNSDG
jgi:hypothetical protein